MPFASFADDQIVNVLATCDIDELSAEQKGELDNWHSRARDLLSVTLGKARILSFGDHEGREPLILIAYKKENPAYWRIWLRTATMTTVHHSGRTMHMWARFAARTHDLGHVNDVISDNIARREDLLASGNQRVIDELRVLGNLLPYIHDPSGIR